MSVYRFVNIGLRAVTLLSKFLLVFFLARYLAADAVGMYGLLAATIGYGIYVVGFEFYTYANRELIGLQSSQLLCVIRDQFVLYAIIYLFFLPVLGFVFLQGWLPFEYFFVFIILLLFEHVAQEANRILVAISRPLLASVVLFVRSGIWCFIVIACMAWDSAFRNLGFVLLSWLLCCVIACLIAAVSVFRVCGLIQWRPIRWAWVRRGVYVAIPFLLASLAIRGVYTFDRYWVEHLAGLEVLGAYTLYVGISTAILSFLDAGVVVFFMPRLVHSVKMRDFPAFRSGMRSLASNVVIVVLVLAGLCWGGSFFVVNWLSSPVYSQQLNILYWLLLASVFYGLSTVPHLGLYALGKDRHLMYSQLVGLAVFVGGSYAFGTTFGAVSVAWAMASAFFVVLLWKSVAYFSQLNKLV